MKDELIPVFTGELSGEETRLVDARDLHQFLEVGRDFSNWVKDRINDYGFIEGQDYIQSIFRQNGRKIPEESNKGRGRPSLDYQLSIDMAKELAMVERNDKGRMARRYFIECEKELRNAINKGQYKPESGFVRAAFEGHEEGSLNPFFREFKTMQRFNIALGYSRQASARKANEFVHTVYGLDMCELNNTPASTICPDEHLELETQRINAGKQSHEIDAFWATYYKLTGQLSCGLNHSNDPSFIALNIKQFKEACIANGLPTARVLSSKKQLQFSKKPAFIESNRVINSTITKKAIRCWIFATN